VRFVRDRCATRKLIYASRDDEEAHKDSRVYRSLRGRPLPLLRHGLALSVVVDVEDGGDQLIGRDHVQQIANQTV
jgi:hypothetical protein